MPETITHTRKKKGSQAEFVKWFGAILDALRQLGDSARAREVTEQIAKNSNLSDPVLEETMASGINRFKNQVAWARQYLIWEGLLDGSTRGIWTLTKKGKQTYLSVEKAHEIFLKWVDFHQKGTTRETQPETLEQKVAITPEPVEQTFAPSLLEVLQSVTPSGFENICKRLLLEHGFENVEVTGRPNDGGIDGYGTLQINPFVSMKVLFQCKRYKGSVSPSQVREFKGAMDDKTDKGIFLTTGTFSEAARREAESSKSKSIELIDGERLVELFEKVQLGVKPKTVYEVDFTYFDTYLMKNQNGG